MTGTAMTHSSCLFITYISFRLFSNWESYIQDMTQNIRVGQIYSFSLQAAVWVIGHAVLAK